MKHFCNKYAKVFIFVLAFANTASAATESNDPYKSAFDLLQQADAIYVDALMGGHSTISETNAKKAHDILSEYKVQSTKFVTEQAKTNTSASCQAAAKNFIEKDLAPLNSALNKDISYLMNWGENGINEITKRLMLSLDKIAWEACKQNK